LLSGDSIWHDDLGDGKSSRSERRKMRDREGCLEGLFKLFLLTAAFDWLEERFGFGRGCSCTGCGCGVIILIVFLILSWPVLPLLAQTGRASVWGTSFNCLYLGMRIARSDDFGRP
jgi:hypothetical protein